MNSNLNLAKPFILHMVREWKGWDAVNCPNQSKLTQSWCEKWTRAKPTLTPPVTDTHVAVTILEHIYQSQPSHTIHNTYDETLEGLRCWELIESIQTCSILVWNVGYWCRNCHHPWLKSQGVALVVDDELKSQPCKTIHYTYGERMEGLRCCELPKSIQSHSILVSKVEYRQDNFDPTRDWKWVVVIIIEHIYHHSQPCKTIHYTSDETLEGLRCCEIIESIQTYSILHLGVKRWVTVSRVLR